MSRVRVRLGDQLTAPFIPFPNQAGIPLERARRGEIFRTVFGPEARLRIAERWDAALCRDAGASENCDTFRRCELLNQRRRNRHVTMMPGCRQRAQARRRIPVWPLGQILSSRTKSRPVRTPIHLFGCVQTLPEWETA